MDCVNYQLWFLEKLKNLLELTIQYKPLKLFVKKRQFFNQNIPWLKNIISWNSQFHNLFFCTILLSFIICDKNAFSGLFFGTQKGASVFQWQ